MQSPAAAVRLPCQPPGNQGTKGTHGPISEAGTHARGDRAQSPARHLAHRGGDSRRGRVVPPGIPRRRSPAANPARRGHGLAARVPARVHQSLCWPEDRLGPGRGDHGLHRLVCPVECLPEGRPGAHAAVHPREQLPAIYGFGRRVFHRQHHGLRHARAASAQRDAAGSGGPSSALGRAGRLDLLPGACWAWPWPCP